MSADRSTDGTKRIFELGVVARKTIQEEINDLYTTYPNAIDTVARYILLRAGAPLPVVERWRSIADLDTKNGSVVRQMVHAGVRLLGRITIDRLTELVEDETLHIRQRENSLVVEFDEFAPKDDSERERLRRAQRAVNAFSAQAGKAGSHLFVKEKEGKTKVQRASDNIQPLIKEMQEAGVLEIAARVYVPTKNALVHHELFDMLILPPNQNEQINTVGEFLNIPADTDYMSGEEIEKIINKRSRYLVFEVPTMRAFRHTQYVDRTTSRRLLEPSTVPWSALMLRSDVHLADESIDPTLGNAAIDIFAHWFRPQEIQRGRRPQLPDGVHRGFRLVAAKGIDIQTVRSTVDGVTMRDLAALHG